MKKKKFIFKIFRTTVGNGKKEVKKVVMNLKEKNLGIFLEKLKTKNDPCSVSVVVANRQQYA